MIKRAIALAALAVAGCGAREEENGPSAGESANGLAAMTIEPGLWETSGEVVNVSAPRLPYEVRRRMIGPRPTARGCIAPGRAARFIAGRACDHGLRMSDGLLSGAMTCPDAALPRPTIATIAGHYGPRRYAFNMRIETAMPDGTAMILDVRGRGRRIGDCPAPAPSGGKAR